MRKLFITIAAIISLTGCLEKQPILYENDTEPKEWVGLLSIHERTNTHSGKSVSVIDSSNTFSLGLQKKIQDITNEKIKKVTFSYWVYIKSTNAKAKTVLSIDFEGKNIDWQGRPISNQVNELNKWTNVTEVFNFPDKAQSKHNLSLYIWNISKEEILLDDFKIVFY